MQNNTVSEKAYPDFNYYFSDVLEIARKNVYDYKKLLAIFMKISYEDFLVFKIHEEFKEILVHTLKVVFCLTHDDRFNKLSDENQQILLWTSLFHDCAKLASPLTKASDGRDPAHPFRSCYKTLLYLQELKLLTLKQSQLELWHHLFKSAFSIKNEEDNVQVEVHNMDVMPKIILFIEKELNSKFFSTVLKLICMHQCIPCNTYPPVSPINLIETSLYFTKEELLLLELFWCNDSYSYQYLEKHPLILKDEIHDKVLDAINNLHFH